MKVIRPFKFNWNKSRNFSDFGHVKEAHDLNPVKKYEHTFPYFELDGGGDEILCEASAGDDAAYLHPWPVEIIHRVVRK